MKAFRGFNIILIALFLLVGCSQPEIKIQVVETPTFSVPSGSYASILNISITCSTTDATIYYTTDGTDPTVLSSQYTGPIEVGKSLTLKSIAVKNRYANSSVTRADYTIALPRAETPTFSLAEGTYSDVMDVEITCLTNDTDIYYTLDGTIPSPASFKYSGVIQIGSSSNLKAIAVKNEYLQSAVASAMYTINLPMKMYTYQDYFDAGSPLSLIIPMGYTHIEERAFFGCASLTSITIPNSVFFIGEEAFNGCTGLTSIVNYSAAEYDFVFDAARYEAAGKPAVYSIPSGYTRIANGAFDDHLFAITIPASIKKIGYSFSVKNLTKIIISDIAAWCAIEWDFSEYSSSNPLWYVHNLYLNDQLITDLVIPDGVSMIADRTFEGCTAITSLKIPSSVTRIGSAAFSGCTNIKKIDISNIGAWCNMEMDNYSLYNVSYSLYLDGKLLSDVVIPNTVSTIKPYVFKGCTNLKSITIPESITSIGAHAFDKCYGINKVNIKDIARWCAVSIADDAANPLRYAANLYINDALITDLVIPNGVTSIGNYSFNYCSNLVSVTIPSSVTSIGQGSFTNCDRLYEVKIDSLEAWCRIDFSSNPLSYAERLYVSDNLIEHLTIPTGITEIKAGAFAGCTSLLGVSMSDDIVKIGNNAFFGCTNMSYALLSDSLISIGSGAFSNCKQLSMFSIPNTVTRIGENAFRYCEGLTSITIPNGVPEIPSYTFFYCRNLEQVDIPTSVKYFGYLAFDGCTSLELILYSGKTSQWKSIKKESTWKSGVPAKYVPCSDGNVPL